MGVWLSSHTITNREREYDILKQNQNHRMIQVGFFRRLSLCVLNTFKVRSSSFVYRLVSSKWTEHIKTAERQTESQYIWGEQVERISFKIL